MPEILEVLGLLLVFGVVLILCYYTTRLIGKKMGGRAKNKNMRVVETLALGMDKCLYLVLVGKKYFLFLSGKKGLELVSEMDMEGQVDDTVEAHERAGAFEFKRIFETYSGLSGRRNKESDSVQEPETENLNETGLLGSIKKLKRINSDNR